MPTILELTPVQKAEIESNLADLQASLQFVVAKTERNAFTAKAKKLDAKGFVAELDEWVGGKREYMTLRLGPFVKMFNAQTDLNLNVDELVDRYLVELREDMFKATLKPGSLTNNVGCVLSDRCIVAAADFIERLRGAHIAAAIGPALRMQSEMDQAKAKFDELQRQKAECDSNLATLEAVESATAPIEAKIQAALEDVKERLARINGMAVELEAEEQRYSERLENAKRLNAAMDVGEFIGRKIPDRFKPRDNTARQFKPRRD